MRGRKNSHRFEWRGRKRAMLRLVLMAAAPIIATPFDLGNVFADSPKTNSVNSQSETDKLTLPPLPLAGQTNSRTMRPQINPFCQPAPTTQGESTENYSLPMLGYPRPVLNTQFEMPSQSVQLASGDSSENEAGSGNRQADAEPSVRLMPLDIQPQVDPFAGPAKGVVKSNPLAEPKLVEEKLPEPKPAATGKVTVARSKHRNSDVAEVDRKATVEYVEGPVSFSLDDATLTDTTGSPTQSVDQIKTVKSVNPIESDGSLASMMRADEPNPTKQIPSPTLSPRKGSIQLSKAKSKSRELDTSATITRGANSAKTLLVPLPSADDSQPALESPVTDARIVKGARPRVDVGVLPVAIERTASAQQGVSTPVAHLTPVVSTTSPIDAEFDTPDTVTIQIKRTEVQALKTETEIRKVQIGDSSICAAVAAGHSQLQLIGIRDGVTRMAVWTASADGQDKKEVYEIRVGITTRTEANEPAKVAATLTQSTRVAFPDSDIKVRAEQGKMIVEGRCASNESAKQALRMIRAACLLPVVDNLTIR